MKLREQITSFTSIFVVVVALLGSVVYSLIPISNQFFLAVGVFSFTMGLFNLMQISTGVLIQNQLQDENRMLTTKQVSFYSRIGMITSLIVLHWLFAWNWGIIDIYGLYGRIGVCIFGLILGWMGIKKWLGKRHALVNERKATSLNVGESR